MNIVNRLIDEASSYLLAHAHNPVDWFPWGEEAFRKAREEDKLIFLSIGYSSCHWCHVMERESFQNREIANLLNESFVCVKVDREERPDVDNFYMDASLLLSGRGGWPLTVIMTPGGKPFYAATYIPPYGNSGQPGIMDLVPFIRETWIKNRDGVNSIADGVLKRLKKLYPGDTGVDFRESNIEDAYSFFSHTFDSVHGGFGTAPRFPSAHNLIFLFDYWRRFHDEHALEMCLCTLRMMRLGGIYDQAGYGFHRYSTDSLWRVPHFEKMLYDQAMMTLVYLEGFIESGDEFFARTACEIITYVLRDLRSKEGGFVAAEDADSEGKEGRFYTWSIEEFNEALGEDAAKGREIFNVLYEGNFSEEHHEEKNGKNILFLTDESVFIQDGKILVDPEIERLRVKLYNYRNKRERPVRDELVLLNWNALMCVALARAGKILKSEDHIREAEKTMDFLIHTMTRENMKVLHTCGNKRCTPGNIDDYAAFIWALLELYDATGKDKFLSSAITCLKTQVEHFFDSKKGLWYFTADENTELPDRSTEFYDGDIPSGFSVTYNNLIRLHLLTGMDEWKEYSKAILNQSATRANSYPAGFTMLFSGIMKDLRH